MNLIFFIFLFKGSSKCGFFHLAVLFRFYRVLLLHHVFLSEQIKMMMMMNIIIVYYAPAPVVNGAITVAFVLPSVCPSVPYIANNSRTQRPSVPKFGRKVLHLRYDSHTSFKAKRSKVRVRGGRGHTVSAEPGGHTACLLIETHNILDRQTEKRSQQRSKLCNAG